MEIDGAQQTTQDSKPPNKLLRLGRKILIGAVIMLCVNLVLKFTGWDSWKKFSSQADDLAENIMDGALKLSPINLWNSITSDQHTYKINPGRYFSTYSETGKLTLKDKILNWLGFYWFTDSGKAFWVGRILLLLAIIFGISMASEEYKKEKDKTTATLIFPFYMLIKFFVFLLGTGLLCLFLYFVIKLFIAIGSGIVFILSAIHASGGFIRLLLDESKHEVAASSKKTVAAYLLPFLLKKKNKYIILLFAFIGLRKCKRPLLLLRQAK
jgi:hypothetical protein